MMFKQTDGVLPRKEPLHTSRDLSLSAPNPWVMDDLS